MLLMLLPDPYGLEKTLVPYCKQNKTSWTKQI